MRPEINRYKHRTDYTKTVRPRPDATPRVAEKSAAPVPPPPVAPEAIVEPRHYAKQKRPFGYKLAITTSVALAVAVIGLGAYQLASKSAPQPAGAANPQKQEVLSANISGSSGGGSTTLQTPALSGSAQAPAKANPVQGAGASTDNTKASFTPLAPASEPDLGQYAFAKTSYDSSTGVYLYEDTMAGSPFTVSQQAIPSSYKTPQSAVDQVAASIKATQTFTIPAGTAYMYVNPSNGQQTIVFSLFGLLVAINSNFKHSISDWQTYINTLR